MNMESWQGIIVDLAVLTAATVLTALRVVPAEAAIAVLSMLVGSRAGSRINLMNPLQPVVRPPPVAHPPHPPSSETLQ